MFDNGGNEHDYQAEIVLLQTELEQHFLQPTVRLPHWTVI